jgi:putative heme-binding domain-containing protein
MLMHPVLAGLILFAAMAAFDEPPAGQALEQSLLAEDPASLANAMREQGDAARGSIVFHQPYLSCVKCHATGDGRENTLGPDLATIGEETTDQALIESVLKPSQAIKKGFETVSIATLDGQIVTGLLAQEDAERVTLRDPSGDGKLLVVLKKDIDERTSPSTSIMPAGMVNALASRQQFLDLIRYLREIADGGAERAKALRPDPSQIAGLTLPDYESKIDHAGMISGLDAKSLERGAAIYDRVCVNCHGTKEKTGSMPTSLRFADGKFKNGSDPYSLYRTITSGFGQMPPQTWMVPSQKYDVIHYLRETYLKSENPTQYTTVDSSYLAGLPKGTTSGPEPSTIEPWSAMDYGPALSATYEVGDDGANFAYKGVAIRLDAGPGGVSRGRDWAVFEHDTMRMAAAWSGDRFIDWKGINFNGMHQVHPHIVGNVIFANPTGPGWANPADGTFADPRLKGRDGLPYGPLPRSWAHFRGQYRNDGRVILSYTIGETQVLESPGIETGDTAPIIQRTFEIGPRSRPMTLQVARGPKAKLQLLHSGDAANGSVAALVHDSKTRHDPLPLQFNGKSYVEIKDFQDFDMARNDFTITSRFQTRRGGTLFCVTTPGDRWVPDGQSLFVRDGRLVFDIGWVGALTSRRRVDDGKPHDVALSYDQATHVARLFIDGRPDVEMKLSAKNALANRVFRIGFTAPDFPGPNSSFDGTIDEIRVYEKSLDPVTVARSDDHILARWTPSKSRGDRLRDATNHGFDGVIVRDGTNAREVAGVMAGVSPPVPGIHWTSTPEGDLRLILPSGKGPLRFTLKLIRMPDGAKLDHLAASIKTGPAVDLAALTKGGPSQWPQVLTASIQTGNDHGPFAVDTFALPENNPWLCLIRPGGFDFLEGGRAAVVCTWDGDVWLVRGLDGRSKYTTWKRIASGLFQPLGVKVRNGEIFVTCRDQIVILRDLNGDEETDFYENFNSDHQVTEHFHEFAMDLQTDAAGNFYYAKAARHGLKAVVPQHGTLLRVSADGERTDILATGFRAPNGVCLNDDGTFFLTDQEGFWLPKNRINHVKIGGFYGNLWGYTDVIDPSDSAMEPPICWITNSFDRSPAEIVRVASDSWGSLKGALLNLSYGNGKLFVVPTETIDGVMQGGMCALPFPALSTGVMRGRFSPLDGQLYTCGLFAWAGDRTAPGGLHRIRATGKPMHLPIGLHASKSKLSITFTEPLDRSSASDPSHYSLKTWSLKRTENYGSEHFDEKPLSVSSASLSDDGRTVTLNVPEIKPTWGLEIRVSLKGSDGESFTRTIHNSINRLP